jgi:hypothetical protein
VILDQKIAGFLTAWLKNLIPAHEPSISVNINVWFQCTISRDRNSENLICKISNTFEQGLDPVSVHLATEIGEISRKSL